MHARIVWGRILPGKWDEYEATYELNAALEISVPEFQQLVSHEVVPGHVTTFAYLQDLFVRGLAGFEASVLIGLADYLPAMVHGE